MKNIIYNYNMEDHKYDKWYILLPPLIQTIKYIFLHQPQSTFLHILNVQFNFYIFCVPDRIGLNPIVGPQPNMAQYLVDRPNISVHLMGVNDWKKQRKHPPRYVQVGRYPRSASLSEIEQDPEMYISVRAATPLNKPSRSNVGCVGRIFPPVNRGNGPKRILLRN